MVFGYAHALRLCCSLARSVRAVLLCHARGPSFANANDRQCVLRAARRTKCSTLPDARLLSSRVSRVDAQGETILKLSSSLCALLFSRDRPLSLLPSRYAALLCALPT